MLMPGEKYLKQRRDIYLKETMKGIQEIASMDSKAWSALNRIGNLEYAGLNELYWGPVENFGGLERPVVVLMGFSDNKLGASDSEQYGHTLWPAEPAEH